MKKILITGESSFLGTSFKEYMKTWYDGVYQVDMISVRGNGWKLPSGYDVIFHVAGIAHTDGINREEYQKVNTDLAVSVAEKAKSVGVKQFIFMSSSLVYGNHRGNAVISMSTIPKPDTDYGKSKLDAEKKLAELENDQFKVCIIRSPMVYGKGCKGNYPRLRSLALKTPLFPRIENRRSMIYVENLMKFIKQMVDRGNNGLFWVQNTEYVNTSDLVKEIAKAHGKNVYLIPGFGWLIVLMGNFSNTVRKASSSLVYDTTLSTYDFDYATISFEDSIRITEKETMIQ